MSSSPALGFLVVLEESSRLGAQHVVKLLGYAHLLLLGDGDLVISGIVVNHNSKVTTASVVHTLLLFAAQNVGFSRFANEFDLSLGLGGLGFLDLAARCLI